MHDLFLNPQDWILKEEDTESDILWHTFKHKTKEDFVDISFSWALCCTSEGLYLNYPRDRFKYIREYFKLDSSISNKRKN